MILVAEGLLLGEGLLCKVVLSLSEIIDVLLWSNRFSLKLRHLLLGYRVGLCSLTVDLKLG